MRFPARILVIGVTLGVLAGLFLGSVKPEPTLVKIIYEGKIAQQQE